MKQESAMPPGWTKWISGVALGAVVMYLSDPDRGRRRRALMRDKIQSLMLKTNKLMDAGVRDFSNRLEGVQAQVNRLLPRVRAQEADDQVLVARVRAKLGRIVSHPHAIAVTTQHGGITLSGPILTQEKRELLDIAQSIPGVMYVEDKLEAHDQADGIAGLQGAGRIHVRTEGMQESWTPALRVVATLCGSTLGYYGLTRRKPAGIALALVGLGLLTRGITNTALTGRIVEIGTGTGERTIDLSKAIEIKAPPEAVFDLWNKYENFPHFMSHVQEVRDLGEGRSHWVVKGPAGAKIEWDAILTTWTRPEVLAWKSEPNSVVQHAGRARFEPVEGGTRVTVQMSYSSPADASENSLIALLGHDPKRQLEDDLMRMKTFIEKDIQSHDTAKSIPVTSPLLH